MALPEVSSSAGPVTGPGAPEAAIPLAGVVDRLQSLAEDYSRNHRPETRDEIIRSCWEWATRLGRGVARHSGIEADVIRQVAGLALCKALARYDPTLGDFESFARATTAGEVRHFLRSTVWPVHVPRALQEHYRLVAIARDDLVQTLGREPTAAMVAEAAHLSISAASEAIGLRRGVARLEGAQAPALPTGDEDMSRVPDRVDLARAMARLRPEERRLLELRFWEAFSQSEIAEVLGTNQVKVSRMLTRLLLKLHRFLGESG